MRIAILHSPRAKRPSVGLVVLTAIAALAAGCATIGASSETPSSGAPAPSGTTSSEGAISPAARADSLRHSWTEADVDFVRGMIHHHAQAVVMARMAPTHGASERIRTLTARILNSQEGEIALMRDWLLDRGEPAPDVAPDGTIEGHVHTGPMPGMLTERQMKELREARGEEFDRLFLIYMIQHHEGALTMVNELFATSGAAQNEVTFRLASDIAADQTSEIERMRTMLRAMVFETG